MKLDGTAKIVAIFSTVVTALIGIAGYLGNRQLRAIDEKVHALSASEKTMDVQKKQYDYSARLIADFSIPLARSFALQKKSDESDIGRKIYMPTADLGREFAQTMDGWETRHGLMTGSACQSEGLKARQIVTLIVTNIGNTDADDIKLAVRQKHSPNTDPHIAWREVGTNGASIGYDNLRKAVEQWDTDTLEIASLPGLGSPESARTQLQIVLASVSGTTSLYGTILVPMEISWTDSLSKERHSLPIYPKHEAEVRANLLGAEIGSLGETCRQTQGTK